MLPSLLRHADRNSMHWSIESRVPFLTPSLSILGLGVRENFLVNGMGVTKAILRGALEGIVDPKLINRKDKVGFETPQESWTGSLVSSKLEVLDGIRDFDYLDEKKTQEFLTGKSRVNSGTNSLLWRTYNLIRWNQLHFNK
jgi:asparagine synthase (glutamine-hydrolysing)